MDTEFFTPTAGPSERGADTVLIVFAALLFFTVLALVLLCLCRARRARAIPDLSLSVPDQTLAQSTNPVELLIPPVFYTEGLRDPLMQEDLRDRVTVLRAADRPNPP
jgi:hypothetical protein